MLTPVLLGSYRGRFAPSPSGPLHFGSLIAATASYLDAKAHNGSWLVRMEDIDTPRVVNGADSDILRTLEAFGLLWDEEVVWQSKRHALYQEVLNELQTRNELYACACTRKQIKAMGSFYQGQCRAKHLPFTDYALRVKQTHPVNQFDDLFQGNVNIADAIANEDYIVKRSDGLFAYQLVVVLDDHDQNITHVIRGADLLEPTARQISLFQQLGWRVPVYGHVPLAVQSPGFKLSKQNHAPAVDKHNPAIALRCALAFLGLPVPNDVNPESVTELLTYAISAYQRDKIAHVHEIVVTMDDKGYQFQRPSS